MKTKNILYVTLVMFLTSSLSYAQAERSKVLKGNEQFELGNFEEALNFYRDAALENPESPYIQYNLGNTLYKQEKYDEAFAEFEKVLSSREADLHFRSFYNMGNALYRMEKLEESILSYTKALELNPDDYQSKHNLEFVRNQLKRKQQEEEQQQQQGDQQNQDQQQGDQQQQSDQQNQNQQQDQQQQQQSDQQSQDQQQQQQQQDNAQPMSKEQAQQILNALRNDEKDMQSKKRMKYNGRVRVLKDW